MALAVQIENNPQARPVANLGLADMVVEVTVEGDVTRFTAIFQCNHTQGLTGPVRSARYYMKDVWQDLHVLPFFFGAGWAELDSYAAAGMPYVNGIFGTWPGSWFVRHGTRPAPHNLYADVEAARDRLGSYAPLDAQAAKVGESRPQFTFDPDQSTPAGGRQISAVELRTNSYWRIGWTWDAASGTWLRTDGGDPNVDEVTGEQLAARTVIVEQVPETVDNLHHDPGGSPRRVQHMVGSGTGVLYLDGRAYDVKWSRPTAKDGTTWSYASTGDEVVLPPGVVWWEVIPTYATIAER